MTTPTIHGYPRQGPNRELKRAIERHWQGRIDSTDLLARISGVRRERLRTLVAAGLVEVPIGDFSLYDHVLDTSLLLGAVPPRHRQAVGGGEEPEDRLALLFAMARGTAEVAPLEMTKWFDTNYHYLVPELGPDTSFSLVAESLLEQVAEAIELGIVPRVVLVGPVTWLRLAKPPEESSGFDPLTLLDQVLECHRDLLGRLAEAGVAWVQYDEPILVQDQPAEVLEAIRRTHTELAAVVHRPKIIIANYFGALADHLDLVTALPVDGLAVDLVGPARVDLERLAAADLTGKRLIAGVVDGRNVWRTDLSDALDVLEVLSGTVDHLDVAASCSLLHVPIDTTVETDLDPQVANWLAFANQKLAELITLAKGVRNGRDAIADELDACAAALASRRTSPLVVDRAVRDRVLGISPDDLLRRSSYTERARQQRAALELPLLPTTTIGSFPQTTALRTARADRRAGRIDTAAYEQVMRDEVAGVVSLQEEIGVDVLVHGEPERNDMVQYFAEQLDGFASTAHGWVQSYGTRCVRPPIIFGDVSRAGQMTVDWTTGAQKLTDKPVKGMLTGPVTMLAWSFVRDDQPAGDTARQVALALRDEVADLASAGIKIIQVDEPALRETLPLRGADRSDYLSWAVESFQLTTAGVDDGIQVHTHMCYADFEDIVEAIMAMDADVISLEAARSRMEIVSDLARIDYPREVGPGVWDIHSPRIPTVDEIVAALRIAVAELPADRVWVNPDCGLKTRGYAEVEPTLRNMVDAARVVRPELGSIGA